MTTDNNADPPSPKPTPEASAMPSETDGNDKGSASSPKKKKKNASKLGRRGDPRMHAAVAARLRNPSLSLFEALKKGGFNYPNDDDASVVDEERVTLGQRKNQLSRRLRLARSHHAHSLQGGAMSAAVNPMQAGGPQPTIDSAETQAQQSLADATSFSAQEAASEERATMAKFHPQFNPLFLTPPMMQQPMQRFNGGGNATAAPPFASASTQLNPGVAVASLSATAHNIGWTLEQLAMALNSVHNLQQIVESAAVGMKQTRPLEVPLDLYQNETRALLQRCLVMGGVRAPDTQEDSPVYLQFFLEAWQRQGLKLQQMLQQRQQQLQQAGGAGSAPAAQAPFPGAMQEPGIAGQLLPASVTASPRVGPSMGSQMAIGAQPSQPAETKRNPSQPMFDGQPAAKKLRPSEGQQLPQQPAALGGKTFAGSSSLERLGACNHSNCPTNCSHAPETQQTLNKSAPCCSESGRHVHRLDGTCGHKAIVHHPEDGVKHIDFVVGDKVECYREIQSTSGSTWLSKYRCEHLNCTNRLSRGANTPSRSGSISSADDAPAPGPQILELSDLDIEGSTEWHSDGQIDGTVLGLITLAKTPEDPDGMPT